MKNDMILTVVDQSRLELNA
jgi:Ion transport protein